MKHSAAAFKTREQLRGFLGELSPQFSKPQGKFVGDMVYGIQAAQDVKLSEIARALGEPISVKKAEFLYYAVADGIGRMFTRHGSWTRYTPPDTDSDPLGPVFLE